MKTKVFFVLLAGSITLTLGVDRINEGASTSRDLTEYEETEIFNYAQSTVRLMLAEDVSGASLTDMLNNRFHELVEFHNEIFSNLVLAEYGALAITDLVRRTKRIQLYLHSLRMIILETVETATANHFDLNLWYEYNPMTNTIKVTENVSVPLDDCLCENERERTMMSAPFTLPFNNRSEPSRQFNVNNREVSSMEAQQYHIIPLALISRFFQIWLSDEPPRYFETDFNDCVSTLFGRIRRSMQKILIVQVRNSHEFSNQDWYDVQSGLQSNANQTFFLNMFGRAYSWLNGNVFLGPPNRGPFDPKFEKTEDELLEAFEYDAEQIIGTTHYRESLTLFYQLLDFVDQARYMFPFDRLLNGFNLFSSMTITLNGYHTILLHYGDWEEREPRQDELNRIKSLQFRNEMRGKKYWAIKKQTDRFPRSVNYQYDKTEANEVSLFLTRKQLKHVWSKFVEDLMKILINYRSRRDSLLWSCNFSSLFKSYLQQKSVSFDCLNCKGLDKYLFAKLEGSFNWRRCNNPQNLLNTVDWCQAWKRIIAKLDNDEISFIEIDKSKKNHGSKVWSKSYLHDVETFMQWLSSEIASNPACKSKDVAHKNLQSKSNRISNEGISSVEVGLCQFSTIFVSFFVKNDCNVLGKSKLNMYPLRQIKRDIT